jgi:hypothetical protein
MAVVCVLAAFKAAPPVFGQTSTSSIEMIEKGRLIYEAGQLGSGKPLRPIAARMALLPRVGQRLASTVTRRAVLACSKPPIWCHP